MNPAPLSTILIVPLPGFNETSNLGEKFGSSHRFSSDSAEILEELVQDFGSNRHIEEFCIFQNNQVKGVVTCLVRGGVKDYVTMLLKSLYYKNDKKGELLEHSKQ